MQDLQIERLACQFKEKAKVNQKRQVEKIRQNFSQIMSEARQISSSIEAFRGRAEQVLKGDSYASAQDKENLGSLISFKLAGMLKIFDSIEARKLASA